jgi:4-amino-4-deoxy-L-arabinose transferase-like glycosyltransferase
MNPASTLAEPVAESRPIGPARAVRIVEAGLLLVAVIFFALHFVHLRADFPNHSPWRDWSKFTDEGWYGNAAIRHYQSGHWNVPGDFNPAAALPVWPVLEMAVFRVTGVSLAAARALTVVVFGLILLCSVALIRRWPVSSRTGWLAPAITVLLLAVNPLLYAFTRLAILEPLLILLTLAAMLAAGRAGAVAANADGALDRRSVASAVVLGLLLPLMVLSKTTGVFLFPAIFWLLWAACGYRRRPFLRSALVASGVGAAAWGGYYGLFVRPRYLLDFRYLFSANAYTGITPGTFWQVLSDTLLDAAWMGKTLFALALAAVTGSLVVLVLGRLRGVRRWRGNPLVVALLLWIFGYGAFLAYHANLQPRYYLVLAVPLTLLVALAFDAVLVEAGNTEQGTGNSVRARWLQLTAVAGGATLVFAVAAGARQTMGFVLHPEYTWWSAAEQVRGTIDRELAAHAGSSRLVLSISGSDLSLMTGLPTICDDFGTMTLPDRVATYKPGWFAAWNDVEDDKMEALTPMYRLVRVAAFPVMDDPQRNLLILYRLDRVGQANGRMGRRRSLSVPRRLRTKVGEQPSPKQLKH